MSKPLSAERKEKNRVFNLLNGIKPPVLRGEKNGNWKGGLPKCLDCGKTLSLRTYKRCKSCSRKGELNVHFKKPAHLCANYRGGVTKLYGQIRNLNEYGVWKKSIIERDGHSCSICDSTKGLAVHHIISFYQLVTENNINSIEDAIKSDVLWDLDNGITLCRACHFKTHNVLGMKVVNNVNIIYQGVKT